MPRPHSGHRDLLLERDPPLHPGATPHNHERGCVAVCMPTCVSTCQADGGYGCYKGCAGACAMGCAAGAAPSAQHAPRPSFYPGQPLPRTAMRQLHTDPAGAPSSHNTSRADTQAENSGDEPAQHGAEVALTDSPTPKPPDEAGATAVAAVSGPPTPPDEPPLYAPDHMAIPEFGEVRDAQDARWAEGIHADMLANLRQDGWLGDFDPMHLHCPLFARKVSVEAVPQFAAAAWRCDGLGFSWECLTQGADA